MDVLGHSLTHPITCARCGDGVFFHTNGNGDVVIFDDLGPPWPVHACYYAYRRGKLVESFLEYRNRMVRKYGNVPSTSPRRTVGATYRSTPRRIDPRSLRPRTPRPEDIIRCDPENNRERYLTVTGLLRELHPNRPVSRHHTVGSVGYAALLRVLGMDSYAQITVVDREMLSYTAWVPFPDLSIPPNTPVRVALERVEVLGEFRFICRGIEIAEI